MIRVSFNDLDNLESCEGFLQHAFPGVVTRDDKVLELTFRGGSLAPVSQHKAVERLLWAWRVSHRVDPADGFVLAPNATDAQTH